MIYKLLIIILLIILIGTTVPAITSRVICRKKEVKQLVTAKHYPVDIIKRAYK